MYAGDQSVVLAVVRIETLATFHASFEREKEAQTLGLGLSGVELATGSFVTTRHATVTSPCLTHSAIRLSYFPLTVKPPLCPECSYSG
jgi:hypothetical protein